MSSTMTRAAHPACAEQECTLRYLSFNQRSCQDSGWRSPSVHHQYRADRELRRIDTIERSDSERLGDVLLGIGYDSSVA